MARERTLSVRVLGDASSAEKALGSVAKKADATADKFAQFGKKASLFATLPIVAGLGAAGEAFGQSAKVAAQTEAVIKSTGGTANVTAGEVGKLASQLQKLSGVEDEAIQAGQNMLLTFTNIRNESGKGNDVFNQATRTLLDMSVALGTDAKSSAIQLGKALNDPVAGVSALAEVGVTFTDQQKEQIKAMVAVGDTAAAQKVILAELNKEFGGSAEAAGKAQTPLEKLRLAMSDMQEQIGSAVLPALQKLTGVVEKVFSAFASLPAGGQQFAVIAALAVAAIGPISSVVGVVLKLRAALLASGLAGNAALLALRGFAGAAGIAGGIYLTVQALEFLDNKLEEITQGKPKIKDLAAALADLGKGGSVKPVQELSRNIGDVDKALAALVQSGAASTAKAAFRELAGSNTELGRSMVFLGAPSSRYKTALRDMASEGKVAKAVQGELKDETGKLAGGLEVAAKKVDDTRTAFQKLNDKVSEFKTKVDEAFGPGLSANDAQRQFQERIEALRDLVAEHGSKIGFGPKGQRAVGAGFDDVVEAAKDEVDALARAGAISADPKVQQRELYDRLNALKGIFPGLRTEIDLYIAKLKEIPTVPFDPFPMREGLNRRFGGRPVPASPGGGPFAPEGVGRRLQGGDTYNFNTNVNGYGKTERELAEEIDRQQARSWRRRGGWGR